MFLLTNQVNIPAKKENCEKTSAFFWKVCESLICGQTHTVFHFRIDRKQIFSKLFKLEKQIWPSIKILMDRNLSTYHHM